MTATRRHLKATLASAAAALRLDRRTAILLGATVAVTLLAVLPVAHLARLGTSGLGTSLEMATVRGGRLGLPWLDGRTAAETQQHAVAVLFGLLLGLAVATLASGAVTIAALIGARERGRAADNAVRRAVGASRRVLRHAALLEAGVIAVVGVGAGVGFGITLGHHAVVSWPGTVGAFRPEASLVAIGAVVALLLLGTFAPFVFARSRPMTDAEPAPHAIFGPAVAQFAASLTILVTAALVHRSAADIERASSTGGTGLVLELSSPSSARADLGGRYADLLERLRGDSALVSLTSPGTITGLGTTATVITDCGHCPAGGIALPLKVAMATHHIVSPDSFQALGIHLVRGRTLQLTDRLGAEPVVVVNRALAQQNFRPGEAIGRKMLVGDDKRWYTVIGIVDDAPAWGLGNRFQPPFTVYLSILQHPTSAADLLIRPRDASSGADGMRRAAAALLPTLHLGVAGTTLSELRTREVAPLEWFSRWIAIEGFAATLLAALGLMAVLLIWVRSLMPELGLRRAVGATGVQTLLLVLRQASLVAAVGVAAGAWFGASVWNALPTILRGAGTWDTHELIRAALPLVVATLVGALLPAMRAMRGSPARLMGSTG